MSVIRGKKGAEESGAKITLWKMVRGSAVGTILFFLLLLIMAAVILKANLPSAALIAASLGAAALSAFAAGFIAVRPLRRSGIVLGALSSLPIILVIAAAAAISAGTLGRNIAIAAPVMAAAGMVGGIVAANKRLKQKRR